MNLNSSEIDIVYLGWFKHIYVHTVTEFFSTCYSNDWNDKQPA